MIWSSCLEPVPPIFILPGPAFFTASMYSLASCTAPSALTQSTNLSSASICTGVRSFQLNGTPVASGVVNRLDSVMMILCGSPVGALDVEEALGAGPARLVDRQDRLLHQVVLGDDALDRTRHLVRAAAGTGRNDELDVLGRLPGLRGNRPQRSHRQCHDTRTPALGPHVPSSECSWNSAARHSDCCGASTSPLPEPANFRVHYNRQPLTVVKILAFPFPPAKRPRHCRPQPPGVSPATAPTPPRSPRRSPRRRVQG